MKQSFVKIDNKALAKKMKDEKKKGRGSIVICNDDKIPQHSLFDAEAVALIESAAKSAGLLVERSLDPRKKATQIANNNGYPIKNTFGHVTPLVRDIAYFVDAPQTLP